MSMICDLCIFAMLAANVVVFVSEPSNTDLAVNALTQFRCSAYVRTLYPDFTLSWVNMDTDTVPAKGDGFSFYSETLEAGGILLPFGDVHTNILRVCQCCQLFPGLCS